MLGSDAAEAIQGGDGADLIADGGGASTPCSAGRGPTVCPWPRRRSDVITDFQLGIDRIDVSAWGMIYSLAVADDPATATGARSPMATRRCDHLHRTACRSRRAVPADRRHRPLAFADPGAGSRGHHLRHRPGRRPDRQRRGRHVHRLVRGGFSHGGRRVRHHHPDPRHGGDRIYLDVPNQDNNIATGQIFQSIEGIVGSAFSDNLVGNAANNGIDRIDGHDRLAGSGGNESLYGGAGNDTQSVARC